MSVLYLGADAAVAANPNAATDVTIKRALRMEPMPF
jgi:hypothetical protein